MNKKISRRELLKILAGSASLAKSDPLKIALTTVLAGIVEKAIAAKSNSTPKVQVRNFIMFQIFGAPPRWTWEPLAPYDDPSTLIANRNVVTRYLVGSSQNFETAEYSTNEIYGINMPWIWQFSLPTVTGSIPMSELMKYMIMIKGVNVINPDHTGAADKQFRPNGIPHTITSLTGDMSNRPIPFIGMNTTPNPYISKDQKTGVTSLWMGGNCLQTLLDPFIVQTPNINTQIDSLESILNDVFVRIENFFSSLHSGFSLSKSAQTDALALIKKDFKNLVADFIPLKEKYRSLLEIATSPLPTGDPRTSLNGINTSPIIINSEDFRVALKNGMYSNNEFFGIPLMAEQFAVIEFALKHQLTTSITAGLREFHASPFDEHEIGPMKSLITNSLWNRGFAACLYELIDQLKYEGMWDNTVVSISPEFGRNPRATLDGSDHAPNATCTTLFSGCLQGPEIIGNTKRESDTGFYHGSWGSMAHNEGYGILGSGHVASTIASLLKVESPVTNSPSLVKEESGKFKAKLGPSKLV